MKYPLPSVTLSAGADKAELRRNLTDMARKVPFEDFNANALILDADGNSWSDRWDLATGGGRRGAVSSRGCRECNILATYLCKNAGGGGH